VTNPAAPQSVPATPPADTGQTTAPTTPAAPVPTPPPSAPAQQQAPVGQTQDNRDMNAAPAQQPAEKTFTQADLDRILTDRMSRFETSFQQKMAAALGIADPNAPVDPVKALEAEQGKAKAAYDLAIAATAESIALAAGIKPERVDTFVLIAQQAGLLKDVDIADPNAKSALRAALTAKASEYPEWKGTALPAASGGDRQAPPDGKRTYSRAALAQMSQQELRAISADLQLAAREGRITA
jgi:hypothetical protein